MIRSAEFSDQFGSNLAWCRELEGISQGEAAKCANIARTTFTRMEPRRTPASHRHSGSASWGAEYDAWGAAREAYKSGQYELEPP
jgi:hypothetical protein